MDTPVFLRPAYQRALSILAITAAITALLAAGVLGWGIRYYNAPGPAEQVTTIVIPKGTGFSAITNLLAEGNVIGHPLAFKICAVLLKKAPHVQAGEYEFPIAASPKDVLTYLVDGRTVVHKVTIPEGMTTAQVLALIRNESLLEGDVPADVHEGDLLPETYHFSRGEGRGDVVARMQKAMRETLTEIWEKRDPNTPFRSPDEALTLASIVEKETGIDSEYGQVASVFINRLNRNMPLQADPTVIYAVTQGKELLGRSLTKQDLQLNSPYNTYLVTGLPPTPIANPGRKALAAVLNPPSTDLLFFVATGKGGHNFASTLDSHNINVKNFRSALVKQEKATKQEQQHQKEATQFIGPLPKPAPSNSSRK